MENLNFNQMELVNNQMELVKITIKTLQMDSLRGQKKLILSSLTMTLILIVMLMRPF